ncbi:NAD-binding protein [Mycena sanguinolenta]|uniref:NAD-binding protein n=1 Tax=Mycena sanguinolenta TaxID=230812 RepID=A0A8H6ZHG5_9AGAR|nr:NAD-binding protein [Mycena sanguinolenta]
MPPKGIALVTGAAQGIGRSVALRLAEDGFDVAINDIPDKSAELDTLVEEIQQKQRKSSKHLADVSQEESVKEMVAEVVKAHGGLDVMVANAGIAGPYRTPLVECTPPLHQSISAEQWDKVMAVNARGTFLCYKHAGLQMIAQGRGGRIIGASSYAGKKAIALQSVYSASKFAVRGLTQAAALEFGPHGITVNAVAPGAIVTPMLTGAAKTAEQTEMLLDRLKNAAPLNKLGTPEDIANLVSFLASKESQFITGQTISINGGIYFD